MMPQPGMNGSTAGPSQWPPQRPSQRTKLRNGTFIIPSTGERSRRQFTLRINAASQAGSAANDGDGDGDSDSDDDAAIAANNDSPCVGWFTARWDAAERGVRQKAVRFRKWMNTPKGRGVLKCTVAYTIASLWTFWPPLANVLGQRDGKHMVATVSVYFHPARSAGSMVEAMVIGVVAVAYAEVLSVLSMAASVLLGSVLGWPAVAHAVVLVLFIGGGFGAIGWVKQRLGHPSVNVGCTLASLAIITVVTKENETYSSVFSNDKIVQVLQILVFGITTTAATSLLLWRVSARALLRESCAQASTALGDMLALITHGFLSGAEEELTVSAEYGSVSARWSAAHGRMATYLREAKYEHYVAGHVTLYQLEKAVCRSLEALAQSIGGLRSAANTQFELLREGEAEVETESTGLPTLQRASSSFHLGQAALSAIDEASDESSDERTADPQPPITALHTASETFALFLAMLGPSMKSLAFTLATVLRDAPFGPPPDYAVHIHARYRQSLTDALVLFNTARADALQQLYATLKLERPRSDKTKTDFEEIAAACGHFSFSLQTFAEEMITYLDVLDDLKLASDHRTRRSWRWLYFWNPPPVRFPSVLPYDVEGGGRGSQADAGADLQPVHPLRKTQLPRGIPDHMVRRRDTFRWQAAPQANAVVRRMAEALLRFFRVLMRDDIRFGIKVGIGAVLWAMLAFINETRSTYMHWRGEWGLLSFMVVCSMTVGASNTTAFARFLATLVGSIVALVNWHISQGHALPLLLLGWLFSFASFYVMIDRGMAPQGRTTLLAYNVITLYAYALSQRVDDDDDDEGGLHPFIFEIAKHRCVAVTAGIIWGLVICRFIWPISARRRFQEGLAMLYLQMGLIWRRGPLAILLRSDCTQSYLRAAEQAALQRYAARLTLLREGAVSEFELGGPFPYTAMGRVLAATHRALDGFAAMSLLTTTRNRGGLTPGERALLRYTALERAMLCDRICHVFQVLASSFMLEYPLADTLPSVTTVRDRLLAKIFQFRKEHAEVVRAEASGMEANGAEVSEATTPPALEVSVQERDYALLYAYALVTGQVAEELRTIATEFELLFGVLGEETNLLQ